MSQDLASLTLKTMPLETAAEVLQFLAERDEFESIRKAVGPALTVEEVRAMLRELSMELRKMAAAARPAFDPTQIKGLSGRTKKILSCLSPGEERTLFSTFGLTDK